jgi:hypothetical protein
VRIRRRERRAVSRFMGVVYQFLKLVVKTLDKDI